MLCEYAKILKYRKKNFQDIVSKHIINLEMQIKETDSTIAYDLMLVRKLIIQKFTLKAFLNLLTNAIIDRLKEHRKLYLNRTSMKME
jgi:hypothetical protein